MNKYLARWRQVKAACPRHGEYEQRVFANHQPVCPHCDHERRQRQEHEYAKSMKERLQQERLIAAGLAGRFMHKDFGNYVARSREQQQASLNVLTYCREFAQNFKRGRSLVLLGNPGTGKTHLAAAAVKVIIAQGFSAFMTDVYDCILRVKNTWSRDAMESEQQATNTFVSYDFLALDEVGVQFGSEAEKIIMFRILDKRYKAMKPTLLISNLQLGAFRDFLGERVFDRLKENNGMVLGFTWKSYRS